MIKSMKRTSIVLFAMFFLAACGQDNGAAKNASSSSQVAAPAGSPSTVSALSISPTALTLAPGATAQFTAAGGSGGYTYSIYSGNGSVDANGYFVAPSGAGMVYVRVSDSAGSAAYAEITVAVEETPAPSALVISPASVTLGGGGTQTFSASGGVGQYRFTIQSGGGSINYTTGVFTAPSTAGTTTIKLVDKSGNADYATVTTVIYTLAPIYTPRIIAPVQLPVYRFWRDGNIFTGGEHFYSMSSTEGTNAGFRLEATAFYVSSGSGGSNTHALYRCRISNGWHFISRDAGCEGHSNESTYGYVSSVPTSSTYPLFRFVKGNDHLYTLDYSEGMLNGYMFENIMGYVRRAP